MEHLKLFCQSWAHYKDLKLIYIVGKILLLFVRLTAASTGFPHLRICILKNSSFSLISSCITIKWNFFSNSSDLKYKYPENDTKFLKKKMRK